MIKATTTAEPLQNILDRLSNVEATASGHSARCPAHEDQRNSLSITTGNDGRVLLHCHANCETSAIMSAIGLTMADLFPPRDDHHHGDGNKKIVATYDYRDESGVLLYQAVRYEPKDFRQRRPDGNGEWNYSTKGVRRVLYRTPELIAADPSIPALVVEGEKDVDRLRSLGFTATCNVGGAAKKSDRPDRINKPKWSPQYSEQLRGRHIVIIPDNDQAGRDHAEAVASMSSGYAASIKIIDLPDLPVKGDVSDWLNAGGTADELRKMIESAPLWDRDAKLKADIPNLLMQATRKPSIPMIEPWQEFPIDAIPEPIRSYVVAHAAAIGCDPVFILFPLFAALSAAIGNTRRIRIRAGRKGWTEPVVLWLGVVGESGSGKSPALSVAVDFLQRRQDQEIDRYLDELAEYEREKLIYKVALQTWEKQGAKKGEEPPDAPIEPTPRRHIVGDITTEALAPILAQNPRGVLLPRDELAGWLGSFDQYKSGRGGDVASWLPIHQAGTITVDRKTGVRLQRVRRAFVSVCGGIQPGILRDKLSREYQENGLQARLLLAQPPRRPRKWNEAEIDDRIEDDVAAVFDRLFDLGFDDSDPDDPHKPVVIDMTPEAKARFIAFYDQHAEEQADTTGELCAAYSKLEAAAARFALLIHLVRQAAGDTSENVVGVQAVEAGVRVVEWFKAETRRVYAALRESDEARDRRRLIEWIVARGGTCTVRDLYHSSRRFTATEQAEQELQEFIEAGLGTWETTPPGPAGGRPSRLFRLSDTRNRNQNLTNPEGKEGCGYGDTRDEPEIEPSDTTVQEEF